MDRKQVVMQRTREIFGERLEDVMHMVRQNREGLRGWEEPAHVRAVLRRGIRERANAEPENGASTTVVESEIGRCAGEPDRGQQRESLGQLLEAGANGLEKMARSNTPDLSAEEGLGLECVVLIYGRPALLVNQDRLASVPPLWNVLEDQREDIEVAQRGVGRIELFGHPEYDWAGTAFLVNETTLLTTRRSAELFIENQGGAWQFRPGITTWMDYRSEYQSLPSAGYRVRGVIGVHENYDLAVLDVEPPHQHQEGCTPAPLAVAAQAPAHMEGRPVYMIGYPVCDARRNDPEMVTRIFRDAYNVKRVQPGQLRGCLQFRNVQLLQHDCSCLGQSAGSCIVDLETHQVLGLHLYGRYLESGTAIPLWVLRDDPLMRRAGVTFAEATSNDVQALASQMERLARSRYWGELCSSISTLYQRAFGKNPNPRQSGW